MRSVDSHPIRFICFFLSLTDLCAYAWQDTTLTRAPSPIATSDSVSPSVRANRDSLFLPILGHLYPLAPHSNTTGVTTRVDHGRPRLPELPVQNSQTIVIGTIIGLTPRFVQGGGGIYTEYHVSPTSSLFDSSPLGGQLKTFDVLSIGGIIQTADGSVLHHLTTGVGTQLEPGYTYLMFLNYNTAGQCFTFVKLWQIVDGKLVAVSHNDLLRVENHASTVNGITLESASNQIKSLLASK